MINIIFILVAVILIFIVIYRNSSGKNVYKYLTTSMGPIYNKIAPYTYKEIRKKIKDLGQNYKLKDYLTQVFIFGGIAGNHDRMSGDKRKNYEGDNANVLITEHIKDLVDVSGCKRISILDTNYNDSELKNYIEKLVNMQAKKSKLLAGLEQRENLKHLALSS